MALYNIAALVVLVSISLFLKDVSSSTDYATSKLVYQILTESESNLIPIHEAGGSVKVSLFAGVQSIENVDRAKNLVDVTLYVCEVWASGLSSWDPKDHDGIDRVTMPITDLWTPDVKIDNAAAKSIDLSVPSVIFMSSGMAVKKYHIRTVLACDLSEDKCFARFQSANYHSDLLKLEGPDKLPFKLSLFFDLWANPDGRFQARDGSYEKSQMELYENHSKPTDVVTYTFSIKDTQPHYRRRPSKLMFSWN